MIALVLATGLSLAAEEIKSESARLEWAPVEEQLRYRVGRPPGPRPAPPCCQMPRRQAPSGGSASTIEPEVLLSAW